jgi:hypothetical protein
MQYAVVVGAAIRRIDDLEVRAAGARVGTVVGVEVGWGE